eukprot:13049963-Ditylum_brightwellii.AAC.1
MLQPLNEHVKEVEKVLLGFNDQKQELNNIKNEARDSTLAVQDRSRHHDATLTHDFTNMTGLGDRSLGKLETIHK